MKTIELARKIAAHLGDGWTAAPSTTEYCDEARLHGPDMARLMLRQGGYGRKPGMIEVDGCLDDLWSCIPRRSEADASRSINIAASKSPERIAAEIDRRLLSTYLPILAAALLQKARNDIAAADKRAFEDAIAARLHAHHPEQGYLERLYFGGEFGHGGHLRVTGDTVTFEFRLPRAAALALAAPLAAVLAADAEHRTHEHAA